MQSEQQSKIHGHPTGRRKNGNTTVDPVCGMTVEIESLFKCEFEGRTYRFCCQHCFSKFAKNPHDYAAEHNHPGEDGSPDGDSAAQSGKCTCPMDPEEAQDRLSKCRMCGMALEPVENSG